MKKFMYIGCSLIFSLVALSYGRAWWFKTWTVHEMRSRGLTVISPRMSLNKTLGPKLEITTVESSDGLTFQALSFEQSFWQWNQIRYRVEDVTVSKPLLKMEAYKLSGQFTYNNPSLKLDFKTDPGSLTLDASLSDNSPKTLTFQSQGHITWDPTGLTFQDCILESDATRLETSGTISLPDKTGKVRVKVNGPVDLVMALLVGSTVMKSHNQSIQKITKLLQTQSLKLTFTLNQGRLFWGIFPIGTI